MDRKGDDDVQADYSMQILSPLSGKSERVGMQV